MDEFNLNEVWKKTDNQANEYYRGIEGKVEEIARKSSHSILEKLKRTAIGEWILSVVMLLVLLFVLRDYPYFYVCVMVSVIATIGVWIPYQKLFKKINATPTQNILDCIESYIEILDSFIKQMKWMSYIFTPIGMALGILIGVESLLEMKNPAFFAVVMIASLVVLVWVLWFIVKCYIPKLYGEPKKEFEDLLASLKSEES